MGSIFEKSGVGRRSIMRPLGERLQADVPIGVFLSGGLDSSTLVALMAERMDEAIPTFTIAYPDASFSELPYAKVVAERFHSSKSKEPMFSITVKPFECISASYLSF